jgi:hypothetical protein
MYRKDVAKSTKGGKPGPEFVGPEIGAEKAYEREFEESRRRNEIVSGIRTKIDKNK